MASVADVKEVSGLDKAASDYERLAQQVEADPEHWRQMQMAVNAHKQEEARNIKLGPVSFGFGTAERAIGGMLPDSFVKGKPGAAKIGIDIEDKLRTLPRAQELYRGVSRVVTDTALGYGGVMRDADTVRAQIEEGIGSMTAAEFAKSMRKKAADAKAQSEQMKRQREFR